MFNKKPKEIELINEITNKPIICPIFQLTDEIVSYVKQFNNDEDFLRKGGLSTEMLDRLAFGFADIDITTLNPNQLSIKWKEDLENVKYEIQKSGLNSKVWASKINLTEPIDVSYERNKFFIEDGHHRFVAAKILNKPLNVNLEIKDNPITKIAPKLGYDDVMRCIFKQVNENSINENNLDYTTTNNKNNVLIYVDGNKILNKLKTDSPEFDITNKDNQIGNRVEKAKEFISNYKTDKRPIHPTTGERIDYLGKHSFEPSVASFDMNGKLGFTDGRHRILAAIESGINKVGVLVPKNQINMFKDLMNESLTTNGVVYHGTDNKFTVFNDSKPIFFVDNINVAKTYGDNVIKAKLSMRNPIELDFNGKSTYYFYNKWYLPSELANKIKEISDDIKNRYSLDDDLKEYLEELDFSDMYGGLDGIIMKNINDAMDGVFSTHELANNYVVFNKEQIHIINEQQSLTESNSQLDNKIINHTTLKNILDKAEIKNILITCYHTSLEDFNIFNTTKIGSMRKLDKIGFFFTKNEEDANDFGNLIGRDKQQDFYYIYKCSVKLNNPYTFKQFQNDFNGEYKTGYDGNLTSTFDLNKEFILSKIKENNCDGLVFGNLVMCLNPNQIKIIDKKRIERTIGSMEKYRRSQQSINESNSQLEDTFIKINSPNIKSHIDSLINKYGEKAEVMNYIKHSDAESNKPEYSISYTYCKKLISLATNLKDKHGLDKDKFELYGGFPLINYLSKELNNKRDIISRSKKTKTMAGFNHQYNKEHERVGLIKNGKKYVDRNLRECIELIKESEVKVNKEASCIVLLNEDKKILLLKRSDKTPWQPGKWSLVGGKIDLGENAKEAGIRECGEETGLGIKGNKLIYCFTMKEDDYEVNFFIGVSEGSDVRLNGEHTEFKWVTPNEIPELETVPNLLGEIKKCFKTLGQSNDEETDNIDEDLLTEKLTNVDNDVDMLYYKYFKIDIVEIQRTGIVRKDMFKTFLTSTNTLTSEDVIKGNEINPCRIIINNKSFNGNNFYRPSESLIALSINTNAVDYCLENFNGDIKKTAMSLPTEQYNSFLKEFTEDRIKGTIHHELAHWLDDTFNNQHLTKRIELQTKLNTRDLNGIPVNTTKMEIQGQIHNIKQLYNKYTNEWDNWTLNDVFKNIPSLTLIAKNLESKPEFRKQWLRDLITRMNREGLLGKNMRLNNNLKEETVINEEMSSSKGLALYKPEGVNTFILYNPKTIYKGLKDYDSGEVEKSIYGVIELRFNSSYDTYEVERVVANKGYGPIMYLIALQFAGSKGLTPTRIKNQVSDQAKNVWKQFFDGIGSSYTKPLDLVNPEDNSTNNSHNEEYLNKKYVLNKTFSQYNKMLNTSKKFLINDRYNEMSNMITDTGDTILTRKMREIYPT